MTSVEQFIYNFAFDKEMSSLFDIFFFNFLAWRYTQGQEELPRRLQVRAPCVPKGQHEAHGAQHPREACGGRGSLKCKVSKDLEKYILNFDLKTIIFPVSPESVGLGRSRKGRMSTFEPCVASRSRKRCGWGEGGPVTEVSKIVPGPGMGSGMLNQVVCQNHLI